MLQIPAPLWKIILQNKGFEGIKPSPENTKPNPDGSFTVKLTPAQWKIFQDNQKKPPIPVPAEPEPEKPAPGKEPEPKPAPGKEPEPKPAPEKEPEPKPAPGKEPEEPQEKPEEKPKEEITITQEPGRF